MPYKNKADRNARVKRWRAENPDAQRRTQVKRLYGLTPTEHDAKLASQSHKCGFPGCGKAIDLSSPLDHDHKTGRLRSILCVFHNTAVGFYEKLDLNAVREYLSS